jgi:DNA-binding transcriptional MerR regulator
MLSLVFKLGDLVRYTGATPHQLDRWMRAGLLTPEVKQSRSSGDHRQFSMLNLIEVAELLEMTRVSLTRKHMQLLMAAQRAQLAKVPAECRAQCAWTNYVRQVMKNAELLGETADARYQAWVRAVGETLSRLEKQTVALPETQLLELVAADGAGRLPEARRPAETMGSPTV